MLLLTKMRKWQMSNYILNRLQSISEKTKCSDAEAPLYQPCQVHPWDKSECLCNSYITCMGPNWALGTRSQTTFSDVPSYSFCLIEPLHPLQHMTTFQRKNVMAFLSISVSFWQKICCHYWVYSSSIQRGTQYLLSWTSHFVKCFSSVFEWWVIWVFCITGERWIGSGYSETVRIVPCEAVVQPECRISLLGLLEPAMLMKLI